MNVVFLNIGIVIVTHPLIRPNYKFKFKFSLWSGAGLLVVHSMYKEECSYIRPFIVIGRFFSYNQSLVGIFSYNH